ncbi:DUF2975 domain-containing protein [Chryseobacterium sp. RP-3-3]|uniref:DUF2975 domain-containing protein n=1 Tax=Chryseobacterium antibioticum TaxID=2728847 RepID=A0A7Y0AJ87_9FLAO|nr:DUF2975 domain-containing protein [Chryseobacterium antibioticum]NML68358.1 DUF2975 domain-containing protein [Chryseobacterium antibioticum]
MKLLGKNSISTAISWIFFLLSVLTAFVFAYILLGYAVCYYNHETGGHFLQDIFQTGLVSDKSNDLVDGKPEHFFPVFSIREPWGKIHTVLHGVLVFNVFLHYLIQFTFYILFLFSMYKIFNGMSKDILFNPEVLKWLRRFSWLSFIYVPISIGNWYYNPKPTYSNFDYTRDTGILLTSFIVLMFGIIVLFIVEFFKKGLELQNQTDLTI